LRFLPGDSNPRPAPRAFCAPHRSPLGRSQAPARPRWRRATGTPPGRSAPIISTNNFTGARTVCGLLRFLAGIRTHDPLPELSMPRTAHPYPALAPLPPPPLHTTVPLSPLCKPSLCQPPTPHSALAPLSPFQAVRNI
jgi:hypothetical protein